jgi:hypothetical protein
MTSYFPLHLTFFGLTPDYNENIYEQFFFLKYHGGVGLIEAYNLPIKLREWFVKRLKRQLEEEAEAIEGASKGQGGSGSQTLGPGVSPKSLPYSKPR